MEDKGYKNERAAEEVKKIASDFINTESNHQSLITVTNISTSKDFKKVTIFVTVFPEQKENAALDFLKRQRSEFKHYVKKNSRLSRIPQFDFEIDGGEKSRQRVDELI